MTSLLRPLHGRCAPSPEPPGTTPAPSLTVVILTLNEALHIRRAIESVRDVAARVFVVDSFSTDDTVAIAEALGAHVVQRPFENYARQFQWALAHLPVDTDWVMRLDADEVATPELAAEMRGRLPGLPAEVTGVVVPLGYVFLGRPLRFGARRLKLLRLARHKAAFIEDRWMDEHLVLTRGRPVEFVGGLVDHNLKPVEFFVAKHNSYATREAIDILLARHGLCRGASWTGLSGRAARTRRVKKDVYHALPFGLGPALYFVYRYVVRLGFLDGREGLIYHVLQGFWYRFLVDCKVHELDRRLGQVGDPRERVRRLEDLTGLKLSSSHMAGDPVA